MGELECGGWQRVHVDCLAYLADSVLFARFRYKRCASKRGYFLFDSIVVVLRCRGYDGGLGEKTVGECQGKFAYAYLESRWEVVSRGCELELPKSERFIECPSIVKCSMSGAGTNPVTMV